MPQSDRPFRPEDMARMRRGIESARKLVAEVGEAEALRIIAANFMALQQPYVGLACAALTIEFVNATRDQK